MTFDATQLLRNYNVELERDALGKFGAAAAEFTRQSGLGSFAGPLADSIVHKGSGNILDEGLSNLVANGTFGQFGRVIKPGLWQSSTYAADLVEYAPKPKFLFKVQFVFNPPFSSFPEFGQDFTYVVRTIDKPKVTFEYEDVNMYNFRTKVLKTIRHEPLNMSFHDDIKNKVVDFFNAYRKAHSPISRRSIEQIATLETSGMEFSNKVGYSAASSTLAHENKNLIKYIRIAQIYANGSRMNEFVFMNPRIENFDFDNMDMEDSTGHTLSTTFNYDALFVIDLPLTGTPPNRWGKHDLGGNESNVPRSNMPHLMGSDKMNLPSELINPNDAEKYGFEANLRRQFGDSTLLPKTFNPMNLNKNLSSSTSTLTSSIRGTLSRVTDTISQGNAGTDTDQFFDP